MKALLGFAPLLGRQKGRLARALLLSLLTLAAGVGLLGVSGWFLTAAALSTAGAAFNLFGPSATIRGLSFVRILARYGERLAGHDATLRLLSDLRRWLLGRLFAAVPLPGAGLTRADLVSRLVADVEALDTAFLTALGPMATALLVGTAMGLGLATLLPGAALAYGACYLLAAVIVPVGLIAGGRRTGAAVVAASAGLRQAVLEGIDMHQDLVALGQRGAALARTRAAAGRLADARRAAARLAATANAAMQLLLGLAMGGALMAGIPALEAGRLDGPLFAGLLLAVAASFEAAAPLVRSAGRLSEAARAAERLQELAATRPGSAAPARPAVLPPGGAVAFEQVRFGYDPRRPVLEDLTLAVGSGERVAIAGPSGAGKSTIAQLLVRLAEPQAGHIRLNGIDIERLGLDELRRAVALMPQDAPVFNDTLRANLRIGDPAADDAALWRGLEAAGLAAFVRTLPGGLDTVVGEAGATLSAGQARRLVLARTLLAPARVLIADEPTAGLDRATELAILRNLAGATDGRTLIVITHADVPAGCFDATYALREGRLAPAAAAPLT